MHYLGSRNILKIPSTLKVISDCWNVAEESLRDDIREDYPGVNEEFITQMFHGKLAKALRMASKESRIAQAFLTDLKKAFPDLGHGSELSRLARGLIADVTLHRRETERVTGGDIGFMIIRPRVDEHNNTFRVGDYRRGLLCQAKLKRSTGKWGNFTQRQKKVLPERLQHLGLLLYSYEDEERRRLRQFQWQLCNSVSSISDVVQWLKRDNFPSFTTSSTIIGGVGNGQIGTDNEKVLDEIVSPAGNPALVIRIGWPRGGHPGSEVRVYSRHHQKQRAENYVLIRN